MTQAAPPRQRTEELERASLSTWATLAAESKGRDRFEEPDRLRTAFQQDRDRILQSSAFARLSGKTHRALGEGHRRDRLSHALQTAQLARAAARALRLNEDLAEAIALGHDLGNAPFGPAGQDALDAFDGGFKHEEQSVRVVEVLERHGQGLNLTWEVRDGILHHTWGGPTPMTAEAQLVRLATRLSGACHDLQAALQAGTFALADVPAGITSALGAIHEQRLATLLDDVVAASMDRPEVTQGTRMADATESLVDFVAGRIDDRAYNRTEHDRAVHCLRSVAVFHLENPDSLPADHGVTQPPDVRVKDYLAGLTDRGAVEAFHRLFTPSVGG